MPLSFRDQADPLHDFAAVHVRETEIEDDHLGRLPNGPLDALRARLGDHGFVPPHVDIEGHMGEHIGSMETWAADFTRCALGAKAWAVLVYDPYDDRWHNVMMESNDAGIWLGANPLVVCDVSEHAFGNDCSRREEYVGRFLDHIDWNEVAKRYKAVDRM